MNNLTIIGNLTRDPETRTVQSGATVCSFTVAVNRRRSSDNQPDADYFRVSVWNKLGEVCQRYLAKGRKVCVTGAVSVSSYEGKDGATRFSLDVFAKDVEFLTPKNQGAGNERSDSSSSYPDDGYSDANEDYDNGAFQADRDTQDEQQHDAAEDDDLPF